MGLTLLDDQQFERPVAVSGHLHGDFAVLRQQRFGCRAVARVPRTTPSLVASLISQMVRKLRTGRYFGQTAEQLLQQAVRADQILRTLAVNQLSASRVLDAGTLPSVRGSHGS